MKCLTSCFCHPQKQRLETKIDTILSSSGCLSNETASTLKPYYSIKKSCIDSNFRN